MRLKERSLIFDGVDLAEEYGLRYSTFEEELPQRKLVTISIPYGSDKDITDRLGRVGWSNGKHRLKFLLYGETEEERLAKRDAIASLIHGEYASYELNWDEHSYNGRASVSFEHRSDKVDVVTIEIDRSPWKLLSVSEVVNIAYGMTSPTGTYLYKFDRHKRYRNLRVMARTAVDGYYVKDGVAGDTSHYGLNGARYELIATDTSRADGSYRFKLVDGWLMYVDEKAGNLVVNTSKFSLSDGDATIDSSYTVSGGNMNFDYYEKQFVELTYEAWDV